MSAQDLQGTVTVREAVGAFSSVDDLQDTIDELEQNGFRHEEMSVLPNSRVSRGRTGPLPSGSHVTEVMDAPGTPRATFIPREVLRESEAAVVGVPLYLGAAAGVIATSMNDAPLGTVIAGAVLGGFAGAAAGGILVLLLSKWWNRGLRRQLDRGGLLLWVHVDTPEKEDAALRILARHDARYLRVHEVPAE